MNLNLAGFQFARRDSLFDWRLLHGIDVDSVIRLTDVQAIEDCMATLQNGSIEGEKGLSIRNCLQLWRLLQLSIEYLSHLKAAHMLLLQRYEEANIAANSWKKAAIAYMEMGQVFTAECAVRSAMSRQRLEHLDQTRGALEETDRQQYNKALDNLEVEDQRARYFHFRKQRTELSWKLLNAVDLEELTINIDTSTLDKVLPQVCYGSILAEDREEMTPHHFSHLIPLSQCCLDFSMFQANATGALLEQAMAKLQVTCGEISHLTSSTQSLHERITALVIEAHAVTQQEGAAGGVRLSGGRPLSPMKHMALSPAGRHPSSLRLSSFDDFQMVQLSGPIREPFELRHTAEMHFKVEGLEQDLRMERIKTEEMRRTLREIKDRLGISGLGGAHVRGSAEGLTQHMGREGSFENLSNAASLPNPFETSHAAAIISYREGGARGPGFDEDVVRKDEQRRAMEILASEAERFKQQALKLRATGGVAGAGKHRRSDSQGIAMPSVFTGGKVGSLGGGGPKGSGSGAIKADLTRQSVGAGKVAPRGGKVSVPVRRSTATDGIAEILGSNELPSLAPSLSEAPSISEGVGKTLPPTSIPVSVRMGEAVARQQVNPVSLPPWFDAIKERHGARPGGVQGGVQGGVPGAGDWSLQGYSGSSEASKEPSRENSFQPPSSAYPGGGYGYPPQQYGDPRNPTMMVGGPAPSRPSRLGR